MKILLVEDEKGLARAVAQVLRKNNYAVDLAHDGITGLDMATLGIYDLMVLDIMLPGLDGLSLLRQLRAAGNQTPVILLTAKGQLEDRVTGLDSGADDYLAKPFHTSELLARLRALSRRREQFVPENSMSFGDIQLNYNTLDLAGPEEVFHLTRKECQLLELLMANPGQAVSAQFIIDKLWGWETLVDESNVQVQVAFLRKKLGLASRQVRIKTIRGVGYLLVLEERGTAAEATSEADSEAAAADSEAAVSGAGLGAADEKIAPNEEKAANSNNATGESATNRKTEC